MDREDLRPLAAVAVGAFAGAVSRYLVALALPATFPVGTLVANVLGAALLGALLARERRGLVVLLAGTGFCSSFTTYSTFAVETVGLQPRLAALNVMVTYGLGVAAVVLGRVVVARRG